MEARQYEEVVATMPDPNEVIEEKSEEVSKEIAVIAKQAQAITIQTAEQYEEAAEIGRDIKRKAKAVKELFAPIKEAANKAHKAACDQEKRMLAPLNEAETAIKNGMSAYTMEQERKRREAEEKARLEAEAEAKRLLEKAVSLEEKGNAQEAETVLSEAQVIAETPIVTEPEVKKVSGVQTKTDWTITVTNPDAVPVNVMGAVIRPVDEAAIMRIVRATKGAVVIPGIKVEQVTKTILRT